MGSLNQDGQPIAQVNKIARNLGHCISVDNTETDSTVESFTFSGFERTLRAPVELDRIPGVLCWYDFSDITTLFRDIDYTTPITNSGQAVSGILDKSENNFNLQVVSSAANEKVFYLDTAAHPKVAKFSYFLDTSPDLVRNTNLIVEQPFTVVFVSETTRTDAIQRLFASLDGGPSSWLNWPLKGGLALWAGDSGGGANGLTLTDIGEILTPTQMDTNGFESMEVFLLQFDGNNSMGYKNGIVGNTVPVGTLGINGLTIGSSLSGTQKFAGGMKEFCIIKGVLTENVKQIIMQSLAVKHGID